MENKDDDDDDDDKTCPSKTNKNTGQQVGVKYHACNIVGRKMYNIKFVLLQCSKYSLPRSKHAQT